ncbi:MAG: GcrA family cell cycle regulator [Pseudomonadota bacterium]
MSWTDERIDELRKLWAEGLSASQIATSLGGVSRNAVIGKIHRLGLSGRVKTPRAPRRPAPRATPAAPRVMAVGSTVVKVVEREMIEPEPLPPADVVPLHPAVSLLDLGRETCRWPVGDPSDENFGFCGAACAPGETYCKAHAALAFPTRARRAKKAG